MPAKVITVAASFVAALPLAQSFGIGLPQAAPSTPAASARAGATPPSMIAEMIKPVLGGAASDKPVLSGALPECPSTYWNEEDIDVDEWQATYKAEDKPACPIEIVATPEDNAKGAAYFVERRDELKEILAKHGTVWLRGFDLTKNPVGFRTFWESMDLDPCLDPIHSSGLRKFLSERDAVYEEVNKQSLSRHYIGLHQEMTEKRTATAGAFVCFRPATVSGGEFLIADGERIFRDMDPAVLRELYDRKVRISAVNLDLDVLGTLPDGLKETAMEKAMELVDKTIIPKFDMDFELIYGTDGNDMRLQAIEEIQPPVNRHPDTGRPAWFCNMHNQARFLRDRRPCAVPEVGMTDIYFGDLSLIPGEMLQHVNKVCEDSIVRVPMKPGDVLLCDNYRVLHGRDIFEGDRLHAVSWFGDEKYDVADTGGATGDVLNNLLNTFLVGK